MNKTLRLTYPQWQGGIVSHWTPDIPSEDSSRGYYLGAYILEMLAPETSDMTIEVPVSLDISNGKVENGIMSYPAILKQTKDALNILQKNNPDKIVTLGGDCAVSAVPFTYLAEKYKNDRYSSILNRCLSCRANASHCHKNQKHVK